MKISLLTFDQLSKELQDNVIEELLKNRKFVDMRSDDEITVAKKLVSLEGKKTPQSWIVWSITAATDPNLLVK